MLKISKVICIINYKKQKTVEIARQAMEFLAGYGVEFLAPKGLSGFSAHDPEVLVEFLQNMSKNNSKPDIALIFGGDGTMIHASRVTALYEVPILGINLGKLGFLTAVEPDCLENALEKLMSGQYVIEERMLLWGEIWRQGQLIMSSSAQNDIVVNNSSISRTIEINLYIDNKLAINYDGDGLVLATPTGSTAYSLSAGGPIVLPDAKMIVATPISPHNLYVRPIIAGFRSKIRVEANFIGKKAQVTFDGQNFCQLEQGDIVSVCASQHYASFVWIESSAFLSNLHRKMCCGI